MALVHDPNTNTYLNPATGQVFHDAAGMQAVTDPGLRQQAIRSLQISQQLFQRLGQFQQQFQTGQAQQQDFSNYLGRVITGSAPSQARMQLQQGVGDIQRATQSQASGATGINQPLAQYAAIQATGQAGAAANQQAALARQQEVAQAQAMRGQVGASMAGQNANMYGQNLQGALTASGQAQGPATSQAGLDQRNKEMWLNFVSNLAGGAGGLLTAGGTGGR